ncbi:MAG: hypothetical protein U9M98_03710 [Patescibacteria group bacterium]|nr:hypothetical protein [Patescibacteria group bacterium]
MARGLGFLERDAEITLAFSGRYVGILEGSIGPTMENDGFLDIELKECACADFFKFLSVLAGPVGSLFSRELARNMRMEQGRVMKALLSCIEEVGAPQGTLSLLCLRSYRQAIASTPMKVELVGTYNGAPERSLSDFLEFITQDIASGILDRFSLRLAQELGIEGSEVRRAFNALCWEYGIKNQPKSSC